jgi:MFS family permease
LLAFDNPARQVLIADLVPREHLQNALSLGSATFTGAALALSLVGFAFAPTFGIGAALLVCVGGAAAVFTTMCSTVIQLRVPPTLRGRVMSLYVITLIGLPSLGSLSLAFLARHAGAPIAVRAGAIIFLACVIAVARPIMRRLRTP